MEPVYFEHSSHAAPVFIVLVTMFVVLVSLIAIAIKVLTGFLRLSNARTLAAKRRFGQIAPPSSE